MIPHAPLTGQRSRLDVANATVMLLSDSAAWVNGETVEVNGGSYFR